ncbi:MAG: hypothetical protein A3E01_01185 [Gammaproteobacteria bacterium RIFCSPHIGHO2_12_FULL_63_22]|nr:MAG: hypothetical protein A3E01_01185 [Gammaproteobacteria bacterium RIFCSPHIGHO2_12_FULL_63_22]
MSRLLLPLVSLIVVLAACSPKAPEPAPPATTSTTPAVSEADTQFNDLSARWLDGAMRLSPVFATQIGDHRFDAELDDLSPEGRAKSLAFSKSLLADLENIDRSKLSRENQVDASVLRNQLRYDIWGYESLQSWAWDPMMYSQLAGGAIYSLVARDFAPLPDRLRNATLRMEKIPMLFAQMRANLDPARVPQIHAQTVAKQNKGILSLIDELIVPHAGDLASADRQNLEAAIATLRKAVDEHQAWLDKTLVPKAKGDFRIGQQLYDQKLAFALDSQLSRADIRSRAEAELTRVRADMYSVARGVLAGREGAPETPEAPSAAQRQAAIQAALELAYADRPTRDKVVETAKSTLATATDFVRAKDLITLPDAAVKVILMPEFQRGVSVAYCDSPGPLDKSLDTFYAVSPIPDDWTDEQTTSYLREYNTRSIDELSIHEAMPGHYVQIWHSNKYPSVLRAVLSSGSFVEGWAVYAEKVMVDAGYRDNDPLYHLIQLKWYLRVITNAIIDQAIHVDGMSRDDAMKLMTEMGFQEEREAAGKWVRAQLSSTQLPTYFVGVQEHYDLRRAVEEKQGDAFKLKDYHDKVLSFGSPSGRYVRALMLDQPIE